MADTTPTLREAAQQALEALEKLLLAVDIDTVRMLVDDEPFDAARTTLDALRAALAEQAAEQASAVQAVDALNTWRPVRLEFGVTMHRDHNPPSGGEWLKKDEVLAAVAGAAPAAEQAEPGAERMILTVLATKLAQAVAKDNDDPDGHDIASGLYGPAVSEWLREVAKEMTPAAMIAAAPPAPARQEPVSRTIDLWFFRELSDEQRMSLFRMAGLPADDIRSDATQRQCLRHILGAAPARQEWQPIETAPKTGAKIIVRYVNRNNKPRTVMARWLTDEQAEETDADGVGLKGGWYECIDNWDDYTEVAIHEGEPSLWMPLPAAPITAAPAEGGAA